MYFAKIRNALRSVRVALAAWYTVTLVAIAFVVSSALLYLLLGDMSRDYGRFLKAYSSDLDAHLLEHPPRSQSARSAILEELRVYRPVQLEYRVLDEAGKTFVSTAGWTEQTLGDSDDQDVVILGGRRHRSVSSRVELADGSLWTTQTAISLEPLEAIAEKYRRNILLLAIPLVLGGVLGGLFLAAKALRPVSEMASTARAISSRNLERRIAVRGVGDDLDELALAINDMLGRLEEAFERIERFSADLAHELRTPLTRLIGETEAALVSGGDRRMLKELLAEHAATYRSMSSMINDTLDLLRTGGRRVADRSEPTPIRDMLEEVADDFRGLAEEKEVALDVELPGDSTLSCDRPAMKRLLGNLLDNAIRHTESGGRVTILGVEHPREIEIVVRDTGEGIPADEIDRIFERFFRGETTRASGVDGFGLGLSIVKLIAEQHGGAVDVTSESGNGTEFRIRLPSTPGRQTNDPS